MMTEKTFHISGKVKNLENKAVPGLRVEAWDKDLFFDDFVAEAVTDPDGRFHMSFPDERFRELFFDRRPDLFFKVRKGSHVTDEVIANTSDSILWNVESGVTEIPDIEVDLPTEEPEIRHEVKGRLLNQDNDDPLVGFIVRAFDLDADPAPKQLEDAYTDSEGRFVVVYMTPATPEQAEEETEPQKRHLCLHILTPQGKEIHETDIEVLVDQEEPIEIRVLLPKDPAKFTFAELATALQIQFPVQLISFLAEREIHSLDHIRRAGGISHLEGLPVEPNDPAVQTLEAHAYLSLLSSDVQLNATLIEKGYTSMAAIASIPRSAFVASIQEVLDAPQAEKLHQKAHAQMSCLINVVTNQRAELANGFASLVFDSIRDLFPIRCDCPDSESAVSPLAYLTELLDYTMAHVKYKDSNVHIDLPGLENNFHQPFGQYPTSYEQVERKVRQVRVCIEVLRKELESKSLEVDLEAYKTYLLETYRTLLNQVGTSYDAIRLARTAEPEERKGLANRLGISLSNNSSDELDALFLTPETTTEQVLEQLLGLVDTIRDPLCDGIKVGDTDEQIKRWNFSGVEWNRNTDKDGNIYGELRLTNIPSDQGLVYRLNLYRDRAKTYEQMVASGEGTLGNFILSERNNSGLSAQFQIDQEPVNNQIEISVIPDFLSWRLQHLRDLWREQDWPADPYIEEPTDSYSECDLLPIIDPDVIGPDDFRTPFSKENDIDADRPFDVWLRRRKWVDDELEKLRDRRKADGLTDILERMYEENTYNQATYPAPWSSDISVNELERLSRKLASGQDLEATEQKTRSDLKLTVKGFTRLMEIKSEDDAGEEIAADKWEDLYSILMQARKVSLFSDWREEERVLEQTLESEAQAEPVLFSPKHFWISLQQPEEGDWPPAFLTRRPLIDPEHLDTVELSGPLTSKYAVALWEARRARLDQIYGELKAKLEQEGFDAMVKWALGHPDSGNDLPHDLAELQERLNSNDPETVKAATKDINNDLYMPVRAFRRLMAIKIKAQADDYEPTAKEWEEVYTILRSAQKLKREYPAWISEEEQLPIIDPDVLKLVDLPEPTAGKRAIALWAARREQLDGNYEKLRAKRETEGFEAILCEALGAPPVGHLWSDYLGEISDKLQSGDDYQISEAKIAIALVLFMTVDDFTRLMEIKAKDSADDAQNKPTDNEWDEVYTILTQAQKFKQGYSQWVEEERGLDYWDMLKARLPRWRSSPGTRQVWQRALRNRSQASLVDPEVIGDDDLKDSMEGERAYDIFQVRKEWIIEQEAQLKNARENSIYLEWGSLGSGDGKFNNPHAVAVDSNGNVYVADRRNHRIQKFDASGQYLDQWGFPGNGAGEFRNTCGVTVDDSGNVYVADTGNDRIQKFDANGMFLAQWGESGTAPGQFQSPAAVAVDRRGDIYVVDTRNHRIQKFDSDGGLITTWGDQPGNQPGQFLDPLGIAVDAVNGHVYVADTGACRIQKFTTDGEFVAQWGEYGNEHGQFRQPTGITVDLSGNVYVTDSPSNRIQKFSDQGNFLAEWKEWGTGAGHFSDPKGLAADDNGNVFLADSDNHRILKFNLTAGLRPIISSALGFSLKALISLAEERKQGNDISARLDQLSLRMDNFLSLLRVYELLVSGVEIFESEWEEVYSILVRVKKCRAFAEWRNEEKEKGIVLSPDFFQIPEEEPEGLRESRAIWEARREWQDKLSARIAQERTTMSALAEAVDACEEATLTLLRDALVDASDAAGQDIDAKAQSMSDQLLIDCRTDACQKTTRISQAITTLQNLIFSLRTGQLEQSELDLTDDEQFDEEWKWIGSYETWKAAVGVFLYPENILLPSLKREQTPAFRALLNNLRANRRLTPDAALQLANEYSDYFYDVCNLTVQATCTAETTLEESQTKSLFYMFALGGKTKQVYWSFSAPSLTLSKTEMFWEVLPVSDLEGVIQIIGATPFYISDEERYIFLFLLKKIKKNTELIFIKYDLNNRRWIEEQGDLDSPPQSSDYSAFVKQTEKTDKPPHIVFHLSDGTIYERYMNDDGSNWAKGEWNPLIGKTKGKEFVKICGFFEVQSNGDSCLIIASQDSLYYRFFGTFDDGTLRKIDDGVYIGGFPQREDYLSWYIFYNNTFEGYKKLTLSRSTEEFFIDDLEGLNDWLISICGLGLSDYNIAVSWSYKDELKHFFNIYDLLTEPLPRDDLSAKRRLQYLQEKEIDSFIEKIKNADYLDETLGEWKLAYEYIKEFTIPNNPLEDVLFLIRHFRRRVRFRKRTEDQISDKIQLMEPVISVTPSWGYQSGLIRFGIEYLILVYEGTYEGESKRVRCCMYDPQQSPTSLSGINIAPLVKEIIDISDQVTPDSLQNKRYNLSRWAIEDNSDFQNNLECIKEVFYFVPVALALQLQRAGHYTSALDWFRTVYDYTRPIDERKIYYGLEHEENYEVGYERPEEWLLDPLNIHAIACTRGNTYTRFTLLSIIRCLLAYADAEFTRDTVESLVNGRTLYKTALELLETSELNQHLDWCEEIIGYLKIELEDPRWQGAWKRILNDMTQISSMVVLKNTVDKVRHIMEGSGELSTRIAEARQTVHEALNEQIQSTIGNVLDGRKRTLADIPRILLERESVEQGVERAVLLVETAHKYVTVSEVAGLATYTPSTVAAYSPNIATLPFCIPPNPMIKALRFHAEINLHKLRTCRNIAGVKREIEVYAAPTDILSAMPAIGPGGQLIVSTRITPPPVPYRYEFLIERAKQLANMAAQMEAAVLSALERKDIESYNLLKARQDVRLARAGVKLQNLRLRQTHDEVKLAEFQQESAQIQARTYQEWLAAGLNQWENRMIDAYHRGAVAQTMAAYFDAGAQMYQAAASATAWGAPAAFMVSLMAMGRYMASSVAIQAETSAQVATVWAGYERRAQEWQLQSELAQQSIRIGDQQIKIANDGVNIVHQEVNIARMQVEQTEDTVEFLRSKFTNVELYDWMSRTLEEVYSYFLQQATSMAKLAQNQLAFERQETPPAFIQDDYWEVPSENSIGGATEDSVDRHGLTGSARLMADIFKLDQYRLETEKRKLQLTKIISLARMAPYEFQRFKETGVITFATSMEMFDGDFPGHYLRMIKRVRTSVIALIPPTQGIKATLSNVGVSRLVVNRNMLFQTILAHRPPESVSLSSPSNATGLFELESQSQMLLPFEGVGVDTPWEFRMPKASNPFDYRTIADVLMTIEYTAFDSYDYRQQVIDSLPSKVSANRPFSFRHQFADQWYDLHNPDQTATPMTVRFRTHREDFPPNLQALQIEQVLLYFARSSGESFEVKAHLRFRPDGETVELGGEAEFVESIDGVIGTRRGNAGPWTLMVGQSPTGEWTIALPDTEEMKSRFKNEQIEDILFVVTYSGRTPEWPE